MTTDITATDTAASAVAMVEAHRLEQEENVRLRAELSAREDQVHRLAAENRNLRELIALGRCADCAEIAEAVDAELNDDDIDAMMRTANDAMVRQLNDVIDVDAGLSAILTRHEEA